MKKYLKIINLIAFLFILVSCNETTNNDNQKNEGNTVKPIFTRNTPLTNEELSGIYKGNNDVNQFMNSAVILELKKDGTYSAKIFGNSIEMTDEGLSPQNGTYDIDIEEIIEKDPYGNVSKTEYSHRLYCNYQSPWGKRVSMYYIHYNMTNNGRIVLLPHQPHFIGFDVDLIKAE